MRVSAANIQFILDHANEEELMEYYLGIPVQFKTPVLSPLRHDEYPSCTFYYAHNGRLYFRDNARKKQWDFLNILMVKTGLGYKDACRRVIYEFITNKKGKRPIIPYVKAETKLRIKSRNWKEEDRSYWEPFGISIRTLNLFRVKPIVGYWLNEVYVTVNERCYAYILGDFKYKLYFVDRPKGEVRFIQNAKGNTPMGLQHLPEYSDRIFQLHSFKCVMTAYEMGVPAYCMLNENALTPKEVITTIKTKCSKLYGVYDPDPTGVTMAILHKRKYRMEPLFCKPVKGFHREHYSELPSLAKDVSDSYKLDQGKSLLYSLNYLLDYESYANEVRREEFPY